MAELTGKAVSELPEDTNVQDTDLFAVSQSSESKKLTFERLLNAIASRLYTMSAASATDLIGAQTFDVNVYKQGNLALCNFTIIYNTQLNAGTGIFQVPYLPKISFLAMVMNVNGTAGFPINIGTDGVVIAYNTIAPNVYYEGSFVYFTE